MTKEQIKEKAKELGIKYQTPCHGVGDCEFEASQAALEMAEWLLQNIQIVKLDNAYNHDLFENRKFQCLEEQKKQLLLYLKKYIKVEEETTDYGTIVKMEIKVMQ